MLSHIAVIVSSTYMMNLGRPRGTWLRRV